MTLPVNDSINTDSAVHRLLQLCRSARNDANLFIAKCNAGSLPLHDVVAALLQNLIGIKTEIDILALVPGIGAALEARFPNKVFTGDTEIAAVSTALGTLIAYIVTQIPKDSVTGRWLHTLEFNGGNKLVQRVITSTPTLNTFKGELQDLVDVFDVT